jgi:hypothetical protein
MKILITGFNKNQCIEDFYLRQQLKVIPSHYSLVRCLRDMGHDVHQKEVPLGTDISEYDKVIVFLASPRQLVAVKFYEGLGVVANTPKDKLVLAFDDWQTKGIFDGILACKDPEKLFAKFILGVNSVEYSDIIQCAAVFQDAIDIIMSKEIPVLMSVFAGGDPSLLIDYPRDKLVTYNPNPYHHNRKVGDRDDIPYDNLGFMEQMEMDEDTFVEYSDKIKMFNFASLVQSKTKKWLKQQSVKNWEVEFFGSKKDGQRRLTEGEMVKVYREQWACLMPGYEHAGSGWWRARPLQVADANSILIGDPKEMILYYHDDNLANITAGDVEGMSLPELQSVAEGQKEAIYKHHPLNKTVQQKELEAIL